MHINAEKKTLTLLHINVMRRCMHVHASICCYFFCLLLHFLKILDYNDFLFSGYFKLFVGNAIKYVLLFDSNDKTWEVGEESPD